MKSSGDPTCGLRTHRPFSYAQGRWKACSFVGRGRVFSLVGIGLRLINRSTEPVMERPTPFRVKRDGRKVRKKSPAAHFGRSLGAFWDRVAWAQCTESQIADCRWQTGRAGYTVARSCQDPERNPNMGPLVSEISLVDTICHLRPLS